MKQIPTNGTCCGHAETLPLRYLDTQKLGYLYVQCYDLSYFDSNPMFQEHLRYSSSNTPLFNRTNFKVQQQQARQTDIIILEEKYRRQIYMCAKFRSALDQRIKTIFKYTGHHNK